MPCVSGWVGEASYFFHPLSLRERCKVMVVLHAYMDDSGSHKDSHACVVAGYLGGVNRWKEFERRWQQVLDKYGVSEFHARVFWRRTPEGEGVEEYKGWNRQRLEEFLGHLVSVIENTAIFPFASGILRSEWSRLTLREQKILCGGIPPNLEQSSANALFLPFQYSIARLTMNCNPGLVMHLFFDDNKQTNAWATICYTRLKALAITEGAADAARKLDGLTFSDSRVALPLQAADLLAWEAYQYCKSAKGDPRFPIGRTYRRALKRIRSKEDFWLFDRPRLEEMIPRLRLERDRLALDANAKGQTA